MGDDIAALDLAPAPEHRSALDAASRPAAPRMLHGLSRMLLHRGVAFGGSTVRTADEVRRPL